MIGVAQRGLVEKLQKIVPDYMDMGERGMADMGAMEMPLPDNTLPMMTGQGPFGGVEMGGMFSVFKVRKDQKPSALSDPARFKGESQGAMPWRNPPSKPRLCRSENPPAR